MCLMELTFLEIINQKTINSGVGSNNQSILGGDQIMNQFWWGIKLMPIN